LEAARGVPRCRSLGSARARNGLQAGGDRDGGGRRPHVARLALQAGGIGAEPPKLPDGTRHLLQGGYPLSLALVDRLRREGAFLGALGGQQA